MVEKRKPYRGLKKRKSLVWDIFLTMVFFGLIAGIVTWLNGQNPQSFNGTVWVIDGDTVVMDGEKIRLSGIDAPELSQNCIRQGKTWACGRESRNALRVMLRGKDVKCITNGVDRYDRLLAVCHAEGNDVNSMLVAKGWAIDYGGYRAEEKAARRAKAGIWQGTFENPQEWRHANRGDATKIPLGVESKTQTMIKWLKSWF
ncbi:MAG: thermonuclease family protein [Rhizobiaceae bacterium]